MKEAAAARLSFLSLNVSRETFGMVYGFDSGDTGSDRQTSINYAMEAHIIRGVYVYRFLN